MGDPSPAEGSRSLLMDACRPIHLALLFCNLLVQVVLCGFDLSPNPGVFRLDEPSDQFEEAAFGDPSHSTHR